MTTRYDNGLIYKLVCKDPSITEIYVGSCCNFTRRKYEHKSVCNNEKSKEYNLYKNQFIRDNGGWNNWDMIEIKKYPCKSKRELELEERNQLEILGASLNKNKPSRSQKEYNKDNKEKITEQIKDWRENHKEKILEYQKEYYENNKEKVAEYHKEYYENNKDKLAEQRSQKFNCECGKVYTHGSKKRHEKSKKHLLHISKEKIFVL